MDHQPDTHSVSRPSAGIPVSHAEAARLTNDPRLIEMVSAMQDITAMQGCVTYDDLSRRGFTASELVEYEREARGLLSSLALSSRTAGGDRVPAIIDKMLASAPNLVPTPSSFAHTATTRARWADYCTARAAFKLDPWLSQSERCLHRAQAFLDTLPLLPVEKNRVITALSIAQRGHRRPGVQS